MYIQKYNTSSNNPPFLFPSIRFCVLNSIYGFSHGDLMNSNTRCICFSFNPSLKESCKFS